MNVIPPISHERESESWSLISQLVNHNRTGNDAALQDNRTEPALEITGATTLERCRGMKNRRAGDTASGGSLPWLSQPRGEARCWPRSCSVETAPRRGEVTSNRRSPKRLRVLLIFHPSYSYFKIIVRSGWVVAVECPVQCSYFYVGFGLCFCCGFHCPVSLPKWRFHFCRVPTSVDRPGQVTKSFLHAGIRIRLIFG